MIVIGVPPAGEALRTLSDVTLGTASDHDAERKIFHRRCGRCGRGGVRGLNLERRGARLMGVPVIAPVARLKLSPLGSAPAIIAPIRPAPPEAATSPR